MINHPPSRRHLLKLSAAAAAAATTSPQSLFAVPANPPVTQVLIVFKCHLDVGFTDTQANVMRKYFDLYYPDALERAAAMRANGRDRYTWTTGSWLLYEYLEQATPAQRSVMEKAVAAGDISYHALPFSWQSEMLDPSMIQGALGFAADLDRRFGRKTIAAKMTDVPGHTRGLIAPLSAGGVRLLDIGVNAASYPPGVPDIFNWKDAAGNSLLMLYHRHDYGSTLQVPGSPLAISVEVRNDNSGPHTLAEITAIYSRLRTQFPGAQVRAAGLSDVALAIEPHRAGLPTVTDEIGDTWIYGIPSDPPKVARYREIARLRQEWIRSHQLTPGDVVDRQLLRRLLLSVEHTWGTDTKSYLDYDHYRPADLNAALAQPGYKTMLTSWQEKRDDLELGVGTLPPALGDEAHRRLATLGISAPTPLGFKPLDLASPIDSRHFKLVIDAATGAITTLTDKRTHQNWASPAHPLALFTYQTLSSADFATFLALYIQTKADWAPRDFGKPGIDRVGAASHDWHPRVLEAWSDHTPAATRVLLHLTIDYPATLASGITAWPADLYLEIDLPASEPAVHLKLTTLHKQANRLPEAMWLSFAPPALSLRQSTVRKVGETVSLSDVVPGGGRNMHAMHDAITLASTNAPHRLRIESLDAPVVAIGARTPLDFSPTLPALAEGVHISLFNNAWGTNYPQWASGDWSFRFTLRPEPAA